MKIEKISSEHELYENAVELRYRLFFKDFDLPIKIVFDELERSSQHFVLTLQGNLIAYGRLSKLEEAEFKISQVVVEPEMQRKGYGKELLAFIIKVAKDLGAKSLLLNSQKFATRLYESLGFAEIGDVYYSKTTGLPHIKMIMSILT